MVTKKGLSTWTLRFTIWLLPVLLGFFVVTPGQLAHAASKSKGGLPPEIERFIKEKEAHARALAKKLDLKVSPLIWDFFATAQTGKFAAITNAFERLKMRASQEEGAREVPTVRTPVWETVVDVMLAVEPFEEADAGYSREFGRGVVKSIPAGSIYFGGTDPGRGLVTAYSKSHANGDPFFTLTQNALADGAYLDYLRATYGEKIRTPSRDDSQKAFSEYSADARKRLEHDRRFPNEPRQLKSGEDVRMVDGRLQVYSTQVTVMGINGGLCKMIFDANLDREFYIEESFPVDWMYPHLAPHELILKVNREPLASLPDDVVKKDHEFWTRQMSQMIGDWLKPETSVEEVCEFVSKVYVRKDYSGFKGDRAFVENDYARKLYSKLRSSIGGLYNWRAGIATDPAQKKRMLAEGDFAFRQAFAMCPESPESIYRYINLLVGAGRLDDALRIVAAARPLMPDDNQLVHVGTELARLKEGQKN